MFDQLELPQELYSKLKKNIEFNFADDKQKFGRFLNDLPLDLRRPLSTYVYKNL